MDFEEVKQKLVTGSYNTVTAEKYGFVITPETICLINSLIIINNMKDVICDLNEEQVENINHVYRSIKKNNLFKERKEV